MRIRQLFHFWDADFRSRNGEIRWTIERICLDHEILRHVELIRQVREGISIFYDVGSGGCAASETVLTRDADSGSIREMIEIHIGICENHGRICVIESSQ